MISRKQRSMIRHADRILKSTKVIPSRQVGCGYCKHEIGCPDRDPKVNKAKAGCPRWQHWME